MKRYYQLVEELSQHINEILPWDLVDLYESGAEPFIVDVREPDEWEFARIEDSILVPRGILESACEWDYDETVPELVEARDRDVIIVCRSGHRSVLAAYNMKLMGYRNPISLKTGLRGWNDYEQPLVNAAGEPVDIDEADEFFATKLRDDQIDPARRKKLASA
jgi:rhodanese-related sulfurtransferase